MDSTVPPYTSSPPVDPVYPNQISYGQDSHKVEMQSENVYSRSTVVVLQQDAPAVRDDFLWSLFNTIYMNTCCLGFVALTHSVKSRDRKLFGDAPGAMIHATTARKFNIAATVVSAIFFIIMIIVWATSAF